MTSPRVLAHLIALGIILGACTPADPVSSGSGGASHTGGTTTASGGANGSGTGGDIGSGGITGTGGLVGSGGEVASGGAVGSGGSGTGGRGGGGLPPATGGAGGSSSGGGSNGSGTACPAGIGLCDDFESYPEGMPPGAAGRWMPVRTSPGLTMVVDSTNAYSGKKALHITGTMLPGGICPTCSTTVISTKPGDAAFAGSPKAGFVRIMMFLKTFTQSGSTHGRMVRVGNDTIDSLSNPQGYALDLHFSKPATFKIEKFNDVYFGSVDPVPLEGKWVCWEYEVGPTTLNFWKDGQLVTNSTKFPGGVALSKMTIGFETYTPLTAIELWYDDAAFDATKRVGCPTAKP